MQLLRRADERGGGGVGVEDEGKVAEQGGGVRGNADEGGRVEKQEGHEPQRGAADLDGGVGDAPEEIDHEQRGEGV